MKNKLKYDIITPFKEDEYNSHQVFGVNYVRYYSKFRWIAPKEVHTESGVMITMDIFKYRMGVDIGKRRKVSNE
jgi:hypothetical protein